MTNFISSTLGKIIIGLVMSVLGFAGYSSVDRYRNNLESRVTQAAVDSAVSKMQEKLASESKRVLEQANADMAGKLEAHAKRLAGLAMQQDELSTRINRIPENVVVTPSEAPAAPAPAKRPEPKRHAARNSQRDAVNRAHADADRMLERASRVGADGDRGDGQPAAAAAPAAPAADIPGTGGLFGLWK